MRKIVAGFGQVVGDHNFSLCGRVEGRTGQAVVFQLVAL